MNLAIASDSLNQPGSVGVMPTDTIYGLVARASDKEAVARVYSLKARDKKPGTIIAASIDQLVELGLKRRYLAAVNEYWPGPLSVIIPCGPELDYLHLGKLGLAVRVPKDKDLETLLKQVGPLLTSSANISGKEPAKNINEAKKFFNNKVDFYIDVGDYSNKQPSTIVKVVDDAIEVIRPGAVKIQEG